MEVKVLDCTLRDGAYITGGKFGSERISGIIDALISAEVDIVECGWLKDVQPDKDSVFYNQPKNISNSAFMFDYGKYDIEKLNHGSGEIIRIAFYKKDLDKISFAAEEVKDKGYRVFLQASNTIEYEEAEVEKLCKRANFIGVDAVYIVDSFGSMFPEDLDKILPVYDEIVDKNIRIGFHSHNNIQLSMGLAIRFINSLERKVVVDSSLCGIGRGAGNLQTELLLEYLNRHGAEYKTDVIREGIKKYIEPLYRDYSWGYTPDMGYRGINGLHPNTEI